MYCNQTYSQQNVSGVVPTSHQEVQTDFKLFEEQIENRWRDFQSYRDFEPFSPGKSPVVLEQEFEKIHSIRKQIWERPEYAPSENLIKSDLVRAPGCAAFAFNNTTPEYNASSLLVAGRWYIACEGPRSKDVPSFFKLLQNQRVTHLVRLTSAFEDEVKKCHPYWEWIESKTADGKCFLNIPTGKDAYSVQAFDISHWRDHQGVDPNELLNFALQIKKEIAGPGKVLLVHCSAGVGRTGTLFAAFEIIDAIDRGKSFSIEEIVYRLSLQRPNCVGKSSQYITLHRVAENYIKQKTLVFESKRALEMALQPLTPDAVISRMSRSTTPFTIHFKYDPEVKSEKIIPLHNVGVGNLLKTQICKTIRLAVFYPEKPRVPHHLSIVLNRKDVRGIKSVSEQENRDLFATIKKISEIYKSLSIQGFVTAQFDTPQEGHLGCYVVEIIPHLPRFNTIKNIVDKMECNRHILFREANISGANYTFKEGEIEQQAQFWIDAFKQNQEPLIEADTTITYPYTRMESHQFEADQMLYHQLLELLQDNGGTTLLPIAFEPILPTEPSEIIKSIKVESCSFCDRNVIERQLVFEQNDVAIFYNIRRPAEEGSCFLLLPKRHTEKIYWLNQSEINNMRILRAALVEVLKEAYPENEVIVYTQDDPSVGQTVFHTHEQIVSVDPATIALTWILMSLYPNSSASNEEMLSVRETFGSKLKQKLNEDLSFEKVI